MDRVRLRVRVRELERDLDLEVREYSELKYMSGLAVYIVALT